MQTKIYSYVRSISDKNNKDYNKFLSMCISEYGNLYHNEVYNTYNEAYNAVFQKIKIELNNLFPGEDWYIIIKTYPGSPEVKKSILYFNLFSNPSKIEKIKFWFNCKKLEFYILIDFIKQFFKINRFPN